MIDFIVLVEIWENDNISYINADMSGETLPQQTDIQARHDITEMLKINIKEYTILDVIGVFHRGEEIWQD